MTPPHVSLVLRSCIETLDLAVSLAGARSDAERAEYQRRAVALGKELRAYAHTSEGGGPWRRVRLYSDGELIGAELVAEPDFDPVAWVDRCRDLIHEVRSVELIIDRAPDIGGEM